MAGQMARLSGVAVKMAKDKAMLADGGGLYLQVTATGTKSWLFRYRSGAGERYLGLGSFPAVSIEKARQKAHEARTKLADGIDPLDAKKAQAAADQAARAKQMTFQECADLYIASHEKGWRNPKHRQQWANTLTTYAYPTIGAFGDGLRQQPGTAALALVFLILTATRTVETMGARFEEFDLERGIWTVPAERIKTKFEHRVPLSAPALAIVKKMAAIRTKGASFVFPGGKKGKPLSANAFLALLKRTGQGDITAHGFRSTYRDWTAEQTHYPREVCEMALAHAVGDKVEAAYRRGDLFTKRSRLLAEIKASLA